MEEQSDALRDAFVADSQAISEVTGDIPFGGVELSAKEQATKFLPLWLVLGQAEDSISVAWWTEMATAHGPADAQRFDRDMRRYWDDDDYRAEALASMPPELADVLHFLVSVGLHTGKPRPQAKESPPDAPQRATGGLGVEVGSPMGVY